MHTLKNALRIEAMRICRAIDSLDVSPSARAGLRPVAESLIKFAATGDPRPLKWKHRIRLWGEGEYNFYPRHPGGSCLARLTPELRYLETRVYKLLAQIEHASKQMQQDIEVGEVADRHFKRIGEMLPGFRWVGWGDDRVLYGTR